MSFQTELLAEMSYVAKKRKPNERKGGGKLGNQNARKRNPFKPYEMDLHFG